MTAFLATPFLPLGALAKEPAEAGPVRVVVVHDESESARLTAHTLTQVANLGGWGGIKVKSAPDADAFRSAVRGAKAEVVVITAHGERDGLHVGGAVISWSTVAEDVGASGAKELLLLACFSARIGEVPGVNVRVSYAGLVDAEIAALDAAHELAKNHLAGGKHDRFAAAHTSFVEAQGGGPWVLDRLITPENALGFYDLDCNARYIKWMYANSNPNSDDAPCQTMFLDPNNPACTKAAIVPVNCKETDQEQKEWEHAMSTQAGAEIKFPAQLSFLNDKIHIGYRVFTHGEHWEWFISMGASSFQQDGGGREAVRGRLAGDCYEIVDISHFVMPGLAALAATLSKLPGVTAHADGGALKLCASLAGGIKLGTYKGTLQGTLEARAVAGVGILVQKWWIDWEFTAEAMISYPIKAKAEFEFVPAAKRLDADFNLEWGPLSFSIRAGVFHAFIAPFADLTSGKSDGTHLSWTFDWLPSNPTSGPESSGPTKGRLEAAESTLSSLPSYLMPQHKVEEIATTAAQATAVPLYDTITLKPGDAFFNRLVEVGAFEKLGLDAASLGARQAVVLDLSNPLVYEALYGEPSDRPTTLFGIPGGLTTIPLQGSCDVEVILVAVHICSVDDIGYQAVGGDVVGATSTTYGILHPTVEFAKGTALGPVCNGNDQLCGDITRLTNLGEGGILYDVFQAHLRKLILGGGLVYWLNDACTAPGVEGLADDLVGVCTYVEGMGSTILLPSQVAAMFEEGVRNMKSLAETPVDFTNEWVNENVPGGGGPGVPPEVHETECMILHQLGQNPPSCQE